MPESKPMSQSGGPVLELSWPCGDRSYGRGRGFRYRAIYRRLRWHWKHRRQGGVSFPPGQWWSPGMLREKPQPFRNLPEIPASRLLDWWENR